MKAWTLIKLLFLGCIAALVAMFYWSSLLVEEDMKTLRLELKQLRADVSRLGQISQNAPPSRLENASTSTLYPNLLEEDPYFTKTLPEILGSDFQPSGILKQAIMGRPENLHPFNSFLDVGVLNRLCAVSVGNQKFGCYETLAPDMALRLELRPREDLPDVMEYWVHLRRNVYWQPLNPAHFPASLELHPRFLEKHPVTAHDFKFFYDALMNPFMPEGRAASLRSYYLDIEEFRVIDDHTFVVRWKAHTDTKKKPSVNYNSLNLTTGLIPLPRFVYQYFADGQKINTQDEALDHYQKDTIWAQNFSHHWAKNVIVSCGPYLFDGMGDEGVRLKRNPEYYQPSRVLLEGIHYCFKESVEGVWQDFKAGKLDLCKLPPDRLMEYETFLQTEEYARQEREGKGIESLNYTESAFYFIAWNMAKPLFSDLNVRKAMTLAIDRRRIIEQNLNEMAITLTGPLSPSSPSYNDGLVDYPFNPDEARKLLDEAGWIDMDGDGIRDKMLGGKRVAFSFNLYYFVKSLSNKVIAEYIASALKEIGVDVQLKGVDITDLSRQLDDKNFDAVFMGISLGSPPENTRVLWHSLGAQEKGSMNAVGFADPEVDEIIEALDYEYNKNERITLYHKFHQLIHEQAPYTFLYAPKTRLIYRNYVRNIFIPSDRQDLIPGANVPEPSLDVVWIESK